VGSSWLPVPSLPWWHLVDCTKLHPRQTFRQNSLHASPGQHDHAASPIILDSRNLATARMNNYSTPTPTRSVSEVGKQHRALRWSQPLGILEFGHVLMCVSRYSSINNHNQIAWIGICSHRNIAWMLTMLRPLWKGHLTTGRVWSSKQAYRIHF
jgi:hypothetical protein